MELSNICRHWLAGRCWAGQGCRFLHPPSSFFSEEAEAARYAEAREFFRLGVQVGAQSAASGAFAAAGVPPPPPPAPLPARPPVLPPPPAKTPAWTPAWLAAPAAAAPKEKAAPKARPAAVQPARRGLTVEERQLAIESRLAERDEERFRAMQAKGKGKGGGAAPKAKTEETPAMKYWHAIRDKHLAEEAARLQAEEAEAARLKAEADEAARLRKVPQTPPRKKRLKLQPKAGPAKRFCAEEEEEAAPTVFQTLAAEQKSAAFEEEEEEEEEVFRDVQTAAEAEAEADGAERLKKVPQTPPRKKRLKLQPKAGPAKRFEATPTVFQTLAAEQKSAAFKEEEEEEDGPFFDVQTEAEAEAARLQMIDDYLLEEN